MLSILVIDEVEGRASEICAGLALAGYRVAALLPSVFDLSVRVEQLKPDVILIQTDSPSRDTLEHLSLINREMPRPVVVFASKGGNEVIRAAVKAGVSAYIVDGLSPHRLQPVIEVAIARFEDHQALKHERDDAERRLAERKIVERAKGVLMKARGYGEEDAYNALRKLAMDRGQPLAAVAAQVVDMATLLL